MAWERERRGRGRVQFSQVSETVGFREAHVWTKHRSVKPRVLGGDRHEQPRNTGNMRWNEMRFDSQARNRRTSNRIRKHSVIYTVFRTPSVIFLRKKAFRWLVQEKAFQPLQPCIHKALGRVKKKNRMERSIDRGLYLTNPFKQFVFNGFDSLQRQAQNKPGGSWHKTYDAPKMTW